MPSRPDRVLIFLRGLSTLLGNYKTIRGVLFQLLEAFQLLTQAWMTFITSILICWSGSGVKVFRCFPNGFRQWPGISVGLLVWRFSTNNKIWTGSEIMAWI